MKQTFNEQTHSHEKTWFIILILASYILPASSTALQWRSDSSYGAEIEYTDNLFMVADSTTADTYLYGDVNLRLIGQSDIRSIIIEGGVRLQRLQRTKQANNEFYSAGLYYDDVYNWGSLALSASYDEASIRTTDLFTIGTQPIFIFGKRRSTSVQPLVEIDVNETNRLALSAAYDKNRYDLNILTDYINYLLGIDWYYNVTENIEIDIQALAQRYDSLDNLSDYDYGSTLIITDISSNDHWQIQVGGGIGYILRNYGQNYNTFLGLLRATYEKEYSQYYSLAESSLQPTSTRGISHLTRIILGYRHSISDERIISTELSASRSRLVDASPVYENDVLTFNLGYNGYLSELLVWEIRYYFVNNRSSLDNRNRRSNSLFLSLTMEFDEQ